MFRTLIVVALVGLGCVTHLLAQPATKRKPSATTSAAKSLPTDWPQFRGPSGQGTSNATGLPTTFGDDENLIWKIELPGAGASTPVVLGNTIYLTCYAGFGVPGEEGDMEELELCLVALNRATGEQLWKTPVKPKLPEQTSIREEHGYASSTPVIDAERIYVFFGKTGVMAFSHAGKPVWEASVGEQLNGWGSANSLVLHNDLLYVNASIESGRLVALNKATGKQVWESKGLDESWNPPIFVKTSAGKAELVVAKMGKILGYDPATGDELWNCDTDIGWYMVPSLVAEKDVVYCIGGRSGGSLAVRVGGRGNVTKTHRVWTGKKGSNVTSPVLHAGHMYWMHEAQGIAYCAELSTGEIVYEERVPRADQVYGSPVLADGKIYYLSRSGRVFVVAANPEFELLATNQLENRGTFNSSPALSGNRLLIRSNKYLYCFGKQ